MIPLKSFNSFLFLLCFLTQVSAHTIVSNFSDKVTKDSFLLGIGIALRTDINIGNSNGRFSNFRIDVSVGGSYLIKDNWMPTYQISASLYKGGMGNSVSYTERDKHQFDIIQTFGFTAGWGSYYATEKPLFLFNTFIANPQQDIFKHSLSIATNFLYNNHDRHQQIGFLGISTGKFQVGYYNDGTPFHQLLGLGLGDAYDRWWTGGGYLRYNTSDGYAVQLQHDKFTGFIRDAFEIGNKLLMDYVPYKEIKEATYNKSMYRLTVSSPSGLGLHLSATDYHKADVQNFIHIIGNMALHPPVLPGQWYLGGNFINQYTNPFGL